MNALWYSHKKSLNDIKKICQISFLVPNLVAFSCYMVNIHLEMQFMRCDTKRAIWLDLYNKYISIFCIKHMSIIFRTLQMTVDKCEFTPTTKETSRVCNTVPFGGEIHQRTVDSPKQSQQCRKGFHALTSSSLLWRHNGHDGVSNHQPHDCLLNRIFRHISKKTPKLHVTGLCAGAGEFPTQMVSNAENFSIWWRHHDEEIAPGCTILSW